MELQNFRNDLLKLRLNLDSSLTRKAFYFLCNTLFLESVGQKKSETFNLLDENSALVALSLHLSNLKAGLLALDTFRKSMPSFDKQSKSKKK